MTTGHHNDALPRPNLSPDQPDPVKIAFDRLTLLSFQQDSVRLGGEHYARFRRGTCVILAKIRIASCSCTGVVFFYQGDMIPHAVRTLMADWPNWYQAVVATSRELDLLCALNEPRAELLRRRLDRMGVVGAGSLPLDQVLLTLEQLPALAA